MMYEVMNHIVFLVEFIDAVRTMMCFGIVFSLFSLILGFMYACVKKQKPRLGIAAMILVFLAGK